MAQYLSPPIAVTRLFNYHSVAAKPRSFWKAFIDLPVISPDSWFWIIWRGLLSMYIIFFLFDVTLLLTFGEEFWIDYTYSNTAMVIYFVGVGMFTVDIFLEFQVGFYEGGVLQKNRKDIFERKALFVLTVDVLTLLVLVLTFFVYSLVLSILKVIFFVKLARLRDISREFKDLCLLHRRLRLFYQIFKITLVFILYCHVIGCIFYGVDYLMYISVPYYVDNEYLWIVNIPAYPGLIAEPWSIRYLYAQYWAVASTSTVGYGDIYPKNPWGNLLVVISNISICIIFGVFARSVITAFQDYSQINTKLTYTLRLLKEFLRARRVSKQLTLKIRRFIEFKILLEGLQDEEKFKDFKNKLPCPIRNKLSYEMYRKFLHDLPIVANEARLMELSSMVEKRNFFEGEIIRPDDTERSLIYINEGYASEYYQLSRSQFQTQLISSHCLARVLEYYSGISAGKSYRFVSHAEVLVLAGPPPFHAEEKERLQVIKMEVMLYRNTSGLGLSCSICRGEHLELDCFEIFPQRNDLLFTNEFEANERVWARRGVHKNLFLEGVVHRRTQRVAPIDQVHSFSHYYPQHNLFK